jgi:predicted ATPase/Tfp pilus assembly protein PilF
MAVPPPDWGSRRDVDLAALGRFEAVELFVERARAVDARFRVTAEDASAVVRICRALEGIPLALELAAARTRVFSVPRIAAWLDERVPAEGGAGDPLPGGGLLPLLTGGARTAPPRHRALQALIDWSHDLLGDDERRLFRRLSVFVGGCSYEAVEGVCAGDGIAARSIPDLLTRLVSCSLVVAEPVAPERYRLLEPLRRYAADRLSEVGEAEPLRDRHAAWFLGLAERAKPELTGAGQAAWLDRLERERENLRAVRRWAAARGAADVGLRLAGALWPFFLTRDGVAEGREWLASALAAPAALAPTAARAEVLDGACALSFRHNGGRDAPPLAEESLGIHRSLGDRRGVAWSLRHLAHRAATEGDHVRAEAVGSEALAQAREAGAAWVVAQVLETLGHAALNRGDHLLARRRYDESVAIFRDLGDRRAIAIGLLNLAWRSWEQGEHATAQDYYQEALTIARELGSGFHTVVMLVNLGALARATGDYARSRALLDEALGLARTSGDRRIGAIALANVGLVARAEGDLRRAESLVKESLVLVHDAGVEEDAAATLGLAGILAIQRGSFRRGVRLLGAVEPRHVQRVGVRLLLRDDPEADEQSLRSARAALGERDFAAAMTEGQAMTLEQAIADALSDEC